ncbi:serine hydrolase domain-containing protein [Massilia cavernae]|uniref:Class A beta-lactamase-related serine hydrolase n=1 Tax=Massilia cavernae TaxID=2320864 RepID=A0A418XS32_9BURK|nr:serine hydrolase domain-containing protein [Massilia cavernae]RJG15294.1 class A beta-lactamase-related serine hydrolase [Massilia cavernae]
MKQLVSRLEALLSGWNRNDAPGCVVSVMHKGRTLLRKGYGMASLEQQVANSPSTKMRIGSTTKHFAAILALLLRDEGRLDIDGPCARYLPELGEAQGRRSLRQFMNHTGGTRDFLDLSMFSNGAAMLPAGAALAYQSAQNEDNFSAGDMFSYNNGGYRMLSIALERVAGMPFGQVLATRLFEPLGMHDTSLWACDTDLLPGVACSHLALPEGGFGRGVFPSTVLGEGGIVSTVDDMQRWLAHLSRPFLWSDALSAELTQPTTLNNGFAHPYGLGLIRENWRGVDIIQHSGGVIGGSCQMLRAPAHELNIIVISNRNDVAAPFVAADLMAEVLGAALRAPGAQAATGAWAGLPGQYLCADNDQLLDVEDVDGRLFLACDGMRLPLVPDGDGLHANLLSVVDVRLLADGDREQAVGRLTVEEQGYRRTYARIAPVGDAALAALRRAQGAFFSAELGARICVGKDHDPGLMTVHGRYGCNEFRLEPLSGELFRMLAGQGGLPGNGIVRLRGSGARRELVINTSRTRGLRFLEEGRHA